MIQSQAAQQVHELIALKLSAHRLNSAPKLLGYPPEIGKSTKEVESNIVEDLQR